MSSTKFKPLKFIHSGTYSLASPKKSVSIASLNDKKPAIAGLRENILNKLSLLTIILDLMKVTNAYLTRVLLSLSSSNSRGAISEN